MVTREQIEELLRFDRRGTPVLSVYLGLDPARRAQTSYPLVFKDMAKEARAGLDGEARRELEAEAGRVQEWLENDLLPGRGLALFSCTRHELWQPFFLPVHVEDRLAYEPRAEVAPLVGLLEDHEPVGVALVDKERARMFTVFLGEIEEVDSFREPVPRKHDQGGPSQGRLQRHHEMHVHWNLERVAKQLDELARSRNFERLILAGPEEAMSELRRLLPKTVADRVVATIPAEVSASATEIIEKVEPVARRAELEIEERVVEQLLDAAAARGRATLGLKPTLRGVWFAAVHTLVVAEGLEVAGSECHRCGWLETPSGEMCPMCEGGLDAVHDVIGRAVERSLAQGGDVEIVHGEAAEHLLAAGEGLGALLRYALPAGTALAAVASRSA